MNFNSAQCPKCKKPLDFCLCTLIRPMSTQHYVLILQHPQEPDKELGTATLAQQALEKATLKVGLSWPNLKAALGRPATPSEWAVLYLGSGIKREDGKKTAGQPLQFVSKKSLPIPTPKKLEGIIVLDGTWSQAKALWWRNPWLLKLHRAILTPTQTSLYKNLRKEPRPECLSTIETIAECLTTLGEPPEVDRYLRNLFQQLLDRYRTRGKSIGSTAAIT
jgi:DTW domain-containing protein